MTNQTELRRLRDAADAAWELERKAYAVYAAYAAWDAAWEAAWFAAQDAAQTAQKEKFLEIVGARGDAE